MGVGGWIVLLLLISLAGYIAATERPFAAKSPSNPFAGLPKVSVQLAPAPEAMVERLTPKWQADLCVRLEEEGYQRIGDRSYASMLFFWTRVFLAPDQRSALLLTNWVEGKEGGKVVISNLEIYSFSGNSFLVTACAQDGAAKLLTGANRPSEEQMSLHLKAVFAESSVRPIVKEHQERLARWEAGGEKVRLLTKENILPSLEKIFS